MEAIINGFVSHESPVFVVTTGSAAKHMHSTMDIGEAIDLARKDSGTGWLVITDLWGGNYDLEVVPEIRMVNARPNSPVAGIFRQLVVDRVGGFRQ